MTTYPYRAAAFQYGPRKGTLGLCLHMSEGGNELVGYLAGNPARGVSANFALLTTGEMWRMTPFDTASGSLNPADRSTNKAYYGHQHLVDVLGDHWTDPNTWCISLEIAGHAAAGPNAKQVAAIVAWAADMKVRFPSLRGAFGHADQTNTKGCPGSTPAMKAVFEAIGGHGLWTPGGGDMGEFVVPFAKPLPFAVTGSAKSFDASPPYGELSAVSGATQAEAAVYISQPGVPHGAFIRIVTGATGRRLVAAASGTLGGGSVDCSAAVAAAKKAALDHVAGPAQAILTAITEARA